VNKRKQIRTLAIYHNLSVELETPINYSLISKLRDVISYSIGGHMENTIYRYLRDA
jgi:hypothetical protein